MALVDKENVYSWEQVLTATAASTNVIDHGQVNPNLGAGSEGLLWLIVQWIVLQVSAGATTLDVDWQTSADNSTYVSMQKISAIPKASLIAGYNVVKWQPPVTTLRYTRVNYTVNTADFSAGKVSAFLTSTPEAYRSYPSGYSTLGI